MSTKTLEKKKILEEPNNHHSQPAQWSYVDIVTERLDIIISFYSIYNQTSLFIFDTVGKSY